MKNKDATKDKEEDRMSKRKVSGLPSCSVWISLDYFRQQTEDKGETGEVGAKCRQTRGKKGGGNKKPCGMKMALWHQFSWQPENCAACSMHKCKHAPEGAKGGERDEGREEILSLSMCRGGKIEWAERMEAACYDRNGAQES